MPSSHARPRSTPVSRLLSLAALASLTVLPALAGCARHAHDALSLEVRSADGRRLELEVALHLPRLGHVRRLAPDPEGVARRGEEPFYRGERILGRIAGHAPFAQRVDGSGDLRVVLEAARTLRGVVDCRRFPHLAGARIQLHSERVERLVDGAALPSVESLLGVGSTALDAAAGFELEGLPDGLSWVELWAPEYWAGPLRLPFDEVWDEGARRIVFDGDGDDFVDLRGRVTPDGRGRLPERVTATLWWDQPGLSTRDEHVLPIDDEGRFRLLVGRRLLDRITLDAPGAQPAELAVQSLGRAPRELTLWSAALAPVAWDLAATRSRQ